MKKPKLEQIDPKKVETCATVLILAALGIGAAKFEISLDNVTKDGYNFGNFKVTIEQNPNRLDLPLETVRATKKKTKC